MRGKGGGEEEKERKKKREGDGGRGAWVLRRAGPHTNTSNARST